MVATIEHQTDRDPQAIELPIDRPSGRSIGTESFIFHLENTDLLPDKFGVVAHIKDEQGAGHTVIFDARDGQRGYTWQHTVAQQHGGTVLRQIAPQKDGSLGGWEAQYRSNGLLVSVLELDEDGCVSAWEDITAVINSTGAVESKDALRGTKERQRENLAQFALDGEIEYSTQADHTSKKEKAVARHFDERKNAEMLTIRVRLGPKEFKKQIEERYRMVHAIGFTALLPAQRPRQSQYVQQLRLFWS